MLENIRATGRTGMKAYNLSGLEMKNVKVFAREGEPYEMQGVTLRMPEGS